MWKLKILIQFALAALPRGEWLNFQLQRLRGAHSEASAHLAVSALLPFLRLLRERAIPLNGITTIEVGTGWEPFCSVLLYLLGVRECHTYDHLRHVRFELTRTMLVSMRRLSAEIAEAGAVPEQQVAAKLDALLSCKTIDEIFDAAGIVYHAPGDASRTGLPDHSVDLLYSNDVLEHVPEQVIYEIMRECKRVLRPGGVTCHRIGLHDHYSEVTATVSKVNFLKYPEWMWAFFVKNSISYHNRLREVQVLRIFAECGAKVKWKNSMTDPGDVELLRRMSIDPAFAAMTPEELAVYRTEVVLGF